MESRPVVVERSRGGAGGRTYVCASLRRGARPGRPSGMRALRGGDRDGHGDGTASRRPHTSPMARMGCVCCHSVIVLYFSYRVLFHLQQGTSLLLRFSFFCDSRRHATSMSCDSQDTKASDRRTDGWTNRQTDRTYSSVSRETEVVLKLTQSWGISFSACLFDTAKK